MDSTNDQKSRDFERRFLPSVGLGFSGLIISLILILVAHRLVVWLGMETRVASVSAYMGWVVAIGMGFLWSEKEPLQQYLESKAIAYPVAGAVFGTLLGLLVYAPAIFLREFSEAILCYKL